VAQTEYRQTYAPKGIKVSVPEIPKSFPFPVPSFAFCFSLVPLFAVPGFPVPFFAVPGSAFAFPGY
jgi:hypothetical protein